MAVPPVTEHSRSINFKPCPITPEFPTRLAGPVWDLQSRFFPLNSILLPPPVNILHLQLSLSLCFQKTQNKTHMCVCPSPYPTLPKLRNVQSFLTRPCNSFVLSAPLSASFSLFQFILDTATKNTHRFEKFVSFLKFPILLE